MIATPILVGGAVVLVAAACDVRNGRIPNVVTLGGLVCALAVHVADGVAMGGLRMGLRAGGMCGASALACAILPFSSWRRGELGGGDVKLFATLGALVGLSMGVQVEGMVYALVLAVLFPYRLVRYGALRVIVHNGREALRRVREKLRQGKRRAARYQPLPKHPPVILGPTIAAAFLLVAASHAALLPQ